jgi:uncharacterized protein YhaN
MSAKRTIHGIDPTAPGGIEALLEHHRALFGDAQMNANTGGDGGGEGNTPPAAPPAAPPTPAAPAAAPSWDGKVESLPADVQKLITDLRTEAGNHRVKARDAETAAQARIKAALEALGIKNDEDPVEAAKKAAQERDSAATEAARARRELAVFKNAATHGADPARLLDSTSFLASIDGLDPSKDGEKIDAAIKAAVESNPYLKATRAVGASGIEQTGGSGEQGQITEEQLKRMSPEEIVAAQNKGLLKHLLGG